jgi:V/A-type H+-transporting ATPase subunit D
MPDITPTRAAALELKDERRAMRDGYVFLDEKCLLLAGEILRELARYVELARAQQVAHEAAAIALQAALARHGLEGLEVYPEADLESAAVAIVPRTVMGVRLQDAMWQSGGGQLPRAVHPSPEAEACRLAHLALVAAAAPLAAVTGNLERLSREYQRAVRRARALQDVLLPELDRTLWEVETRLEELEQEEAITMRRRVWQEEK